MADEAKQEAVEETVEQPTEAQGAEAPSPEQRLDISEILGSLQVASAEVTRWQGIQATLTKCAILFDSIVKSQQAQQGEAPGAGVSETE